MDKEDFYRLPKILARADGFISKSTGEAVSLSSSAKLVYCYMLSRNQFFVTQQAGKHYESQQTIAEACGIEIKQAGRILRSFVDHGILEARKLKPDGQSQWRWFYEKVHTKITLWDGTQEKFEILEKPEPSKTTIDKTKPVPVESNYDWNETDLPF